MTLEGDIIVDGVLASCYASFDHDLAHLITTPIRWYPEITERIFGVENGSPGYIDLARPLADQYYYRKLSSINTASTLHET